MQPPEMLRTAALVFWMMFGYNETNWNLRQGEPVMELGQKIIVIGCPGSGKSTLSKELRDVTGLPLFHLDNIWWKPDKSHISRVEFDQKLNEILLTDRWIIDGNYNRTYEMRFQACDTVIFLDYPVNVCMNGIKERIGRSRTDTP